MARILFCSSNPKGTSALNLDGEFNALEGVISDRGLKVCVEVRHIKRTTFELLSSEVGDFQPHMLILAGHSTHGRAEGHRPDGRILTESASGAPVHTPSPALGPLIERLAPKLRCLMLNLCDLASEAEAMLQYVPYVIGMKGDIADSMAITFSTRYCYHVAHGLSLSEAFRQARNDAYGMNHSQWSIPQQFFRPGADRLSLVHKVTMVCLHHPNERKAYKELEKALTIERQAGLVALESSGPPMQRAASARHTNQIALDDAELSVCLLSPDFLDDNQCRQVVQAAIRRKERDGAEVISLLAEQCAYEVSVLGRHPMLPEDGSIRPSSPPRRDAYWTRIRDELLPHIHEQEAAVLDRAWANIISAPMPAKPPSQQRLAPVKIALSEEQEVDLLAVISRESTTSRLLHKVRGILSYLAPNPRLHPPLRFALRHRNGQTFLQTWPGLMDTSNHPLGIEVNLELAQPGSIFYYYPQKLIYPSYKYRIAFQRGKTLTLAVFGVKEQRELIFQIEIVPSAHMNTEARLP